MPKISVIMPVYNGEAYLREAIDSILGQTYTDFEFIIIDDGSTDSSPEIVRSYEDSRIRFYQNEHNMGVAATLNRGLDLATGEYIARMDADDISLPERFAKQAAYMDTHQNIAVCGCGIRLIGARTGKRIFAQTPEQMKVDMLFSCGLAHPTVMMRGTVFGGKGLHYDPAFSKMEDYALWAETLKRYEIVCIPEILFQYRIHPNQITQHYSNENRIQHRELKKRQVEQLGLSGEGDGFEAFLKGGKSLTEEETVALCKYLREIYTANCEQKTYDARCLKRTLRTVANGALSRFPRQTAAQIAGTCGVNKWIYSGGRVIRGVKAVLRNDLTIKRRRFRLKYRDFTILSNNCWGGMVYQKYGLEYNTPTVGLGIRNGSEFVRFCSNLKRYLSEELIFIPWENAKYRTEWEIINKNQYPVAKLGDIEVNFSHYTSEAEAREKWERRKKRINPKRMIFKLSQRECCTREDVEHFLALPVEHKICFAYDDVPGAVVIPELRDWAGDETPLIEQHFNELDYLNRL